jgi:hypothetical protein
MKIIEVLLPLLALLGLLYVLYRAALWAEQDAICRGKSPFFVKCAVILFFPWGLIAWLLFRPDPIDDQQMRQQDFDINDYRKQ